MRRLLFLPDVIAAMRAEDPHIPLGLICDRKDELARWPHLPVSYVIVHHKLATRPLLEDVKAAGKRLFVWTVNSAAQMRQFSEWGVDGIISDRTKLLRETLNI